MATSLYDDIARIALDRPRLQRIVNGDAAATVETDGGQVPSLSRLLASMGAGTVRGAWVTATAYILGDVVTSGGTAYRCVTAHTSAAAFATDLTASRWIVHYTATSTVDTVAILKAAANTYGTMVVFGYYAVGDGGGGLFRWNGASVVADNGGTVIQPSSLPAAGRWERICEGLLDVRWFGAKGDNTANDMAAVVAAEAAAGSVGLLFPAGTYKLSSSQVFTKAWTFQPGAMISVDATFTATVNGAVYGNGGQCFTGAGSVVGTFGTVDLRPEWFGAVADGNKATGAGTDNGPAFNRCISARTHSATVSSCVRVGPGVFRVGTRIDIPEGVSVLGSGPWSTYLVCLSAYASDIVRFNGVGGPPARFSGFSVNAQVGGAFAATGIRVASNGTFIDSVWVNGLGTGMAFTVAATDCFLSNFAIELCTTGLSIASTDVNVTHGTLFGNGDGCSIDNSAGGISGPVILSQVRCNLSTSNGFNVSNSKNVIFQACAAVHPNSGAFNTSGFNLQGSNDGIQINDCIAHLGSTPHSATADGIIIAGTSTNVIVNGGQFRGWRDGISITSSGATIIVKGVNVSGNLRSGIYAAAWGGPSLQILGCTASYNGSVAAGDAQINVAMAGPYQSAIVSGNLCDQGGGGPAEYGIQVSCTNALSGGVCQGNRSTNHATANYNFIGANIANVIVTGANA